MHGRCNTVRKSILPNLAIDSKQSKSKFQRLFCIKCQMDSKIHTELQRA